MSEAQLEKMADDWLKANDDYYKSKKRNKRESMNYPYLTETQLDRVSRLEYPISNLSFKQYQIVGEHEDVETYLDRKSA